jgi:carbonic anhydrase
MTGRVLGRRRLAWAVAGAACVAVASGAVVAQQLPHWTYEGDTGPQYWGVLDVSYAACGVGTSQSPVDIPPDAPMVADDVVSAYTDSALTIVNNGHAIQVDYDDGSFVEIDGSTYELEQFHFHSPSEHTTAGVNAAMEMHLVHADADGNQAVVGVLLVEGAANPAFAPVWDNMPADEGDPVTVEGITINATDLLPADLDYYRYIGSLTTPPCTEDVLWHMLATPVELSDEQIAQFRAIHDGTNRPTQPLNERVFGSE